MGPGRGGQGCSEDFDPLADAQPVGESWVEFGRKIEIALAFDTLPEIVTEGRAGDLRRAAMSGFVVALGKAESGGPLWQVIPAVAPR